MGGLITLKRGTGALELRLGGLGGPEFGEALAKVKQIPGKRWNPEAKVWELPDDTETLVRVVETMRPVLDAELKAEMMSAKGEIADDLVTRAGKDADLKVPWASQLWPFQRAGVDFMVKYRRTINADSMGLGKLQSTGSPVLTPLGWTTMGALKPGDRVIGRNGQPTTVTNVYPQGVKQLFRVTFSDGVSTLAGAEHLWSVKSPSDRARGGDWRTMKTEDLLPTTDAAGNRRWSIPLVEPVEFDPPKDALPLDPYYLGVLLGDGSFRSTSTPGITSPVRDDYIIQRCRQRTTDSIERLPSCPDQKQLSVTGGATTKALRDLGLWGHLSVDKWVPEPYLVSSAADRLELLRGIMDTDGYNQPPNRDGSPACSAEITISSSLLADGIQELVWSLGGTARRRLKKTTHRDAHRITVKLPPGMNPFSLPRKAAGYGRRTKYPLGRYIESIEPEVEGEAVCIAVDAPDHLYVTENYIVTHNTIQSITAVEEFWLRDKPDTGRTGPVLVVCPNTLKDNWLKEITKGPNPEYFDVSLWPELTATIVDAKTPKERWPQVKAAADRGDYVIVNWEKLRLIPELSKIHWAGVIADEAHRAKNYKSAQSKALRKLRAAVQVAATGTPIMNSPDELWALLNWMEPKTYSSYWAFFHTYVESYSGYRGSHVITGVRNADNLRFELRNRLVRRVKNQVLEDFPEKLPEEIIEVDMVPAQRRAYVEAQHAFLFDIEAAMKDPDLDHTKKQNIIEALRSGDVAQVGRLVENAAARVSLMRQIATSPGLVDGAEDKSGKLDAIVETISDNAGKQFVVACWHKKTAELLVERLGRLKPAVDADFFHGDVSLDDRTGLVERFQAGDLQVLVLTIAAGGVGITLTAANTILFAEEDWVPANNRQMEDRLYRIGQKNDVSVVKFRSKNTVDTLDIAPANRLKELIEDAVYGEG